MISALTFLLTLLTCVLAQSNGGARSRVLIPLGQIQGPSWGPAAQKCIFAPDPQENYKGYPATRFRYRLDAGEYAHKLVLSGLDFAPDRFALSVRGCGDPNLRIIVRVLDGQGEEFNVRPEGDLIPRHKGWREFAWEGGYRDSWGEAKNGRADPPIRQVQLFFIGRGQAVCQGEIAFATLTLEGPVSPSRAGVTTRTTAPLTAELLGALENLEATPKSLRVEVTNRGAQPLTGTLDIAERPAGVGVSPERVALRDLPLGRKRTFWFDVHAERFNPYNRYCFVLRLRVGNTTLTQTVRVDGERSSGVNLGELRDSTTIAASPFGVGTHFEQGYDYHRSIPLLRAMGAKWVRDGIQVRPTAAGQWELTDYSRQYLAALREAGIHLCAVTYGPYEPDRYADMMRFLVRECGNHVKVWEIWNEPHNFGFREKYGGAWNGVGDSPWVGKFVELVRAAARAVHELDPKAIVISGDDVHPNTYRFLQLGMADDVDGLTLHPYNHAGNPPEYTGWGTPEQVKRDGIVVADPDTSYTSLIRRYREVAPREQLWITEYGFVNDPVVKGNTFFHPVNEEATAKYLARFYLLNFALGMDCILQHTFQDGGDGPMGLIRADFSPKLAYQVLGRIFGLFDSSWKLATDIPVVLEGNAQLSTREALWMDGDVGLMKLPVQGGVHAYVWRQPERHELALALWNACWPEALSPPIARTVKIKAPGYGHAIAIDLLTGDHPDLPATRVEGDGTLVFENLPVPDYPVVIKLFAG